MEGTAPRLLGRFHFLDCQLLSVFIIPHVMVEKLKWHHHLSQIASVYSFLSSVENKVHSYLRGKSLLPLQMGHQSFHSTLLLMNGDNYKWWEGCFHCLKHKLLYRPRFLIICTGRRGVIWPWFQLHFTVDVDSANSLDLLLYNQILHH